MKLGMSKNSSPMAKPEIVGTVLSYGISFMNFCWFGMGMVLRDTPAEVPRPIYQH
ncbi:hypothetical protein Hanom_Chr14g01245961 [Helianthus anomalus]